MTPSVLALFHHLSLALRLHAVVPSLPLDEVATNVAAAEAAATPRVSAQLLLAIAFVESRYDATATSRVEGQTRKTGHYASTVAPANLAVNASLYCGPLQTFAASWGDCLAMREPQTGYAAGAAELEQWLRDTRVRGNVEVALAGHGCGNFGVTTGRCNAYPARVRMLERMLTPVVTTPRAADARPIPRS